jgi:aminoglycoside 2''-phosphotransferase
VNQKQNERLDYIRTHAPGISLNDAVFEFINGEHSDIVVIDEKEMFKFAKYDWSAVYINNAVKAIRLIGNYVDTVLPRMNPLEPGVAEMDYVKGAPLYRNQVLLLKSYDQTALARQIGTFLSKLHAIPLKEARACRMDEDDRDMMTPEYWESEYKDIQNKVYPYCDDYTKEYVRQLFEPVLEREDFFVCSPSVIHGNLAPSHIIYNSESHRIATITGFGTSRIGDPAYDTGILLSGLGEAFLKRVSEYDKTIPMHMDRARFYAAYQRIARAKNLADRITTRDFTDYRLDLTESDIMPIGKRYWS